jgi:hypothetical protein
MQRTWAWFVTLSAALGVVHLQTTPEDNIPLGSCEIPALEALGSTVTPSSEGLVFMSLTGNDVQGQPVQILTANPVCLTSGERRDTVGSISFVVEYMECVTPSSCMTRTEQFQFDCAVRITGVAEFSPPTKQGGFIRSTDLRGATLDTMLNERCGDCSQVAVNAIAPDVVTHCVGM